MPGRADPDSGDLRRAGVNARLHVPQRFLRRSKLASNPQARERRGVISDAVQEYLASLDAAELSTPPDELGEEWFRTYDETAHVAYEAQPPRRLRRISAWFRRARPA